MSIATIDNQQVHYEIMGHGETVVFLHGWVGSWRTWWPCMKTMSKRYRTIAMDFWGYGNSDRMPESYFLGAYVEQLFLFLDYLGVAEPVTLVGHALGAAVAIRYAHLHRPSVRRLVLVAAPLIGNSINPDLARLTAPAFVHRYLYKYREIPELKDEIPKVDPRAMNTIADQIAGYDFAADMDGLGLPAIVVVGEHDQVVNKPLDGIIALNRKHEKQRYVTLKHGDHFPMLEQLDAFLKLLHGFIQQDEHQGLSQVQVKSTIPYPI